MQFDRSAAASALIGIGREFHRRGWSLGTSSNYSVVASRDPLELLVTASGKDKSALGEEDFLRVDGNGGLLAGEGPGKASAETMLHCMIASVLPWVGGILHTHSVWGTILSRIDLPRGSLRIEGYEMLKGLSGIETHETAEEVPIFANSQRIDALADQIRLRFLSPEWGEGSRPPFHGFLLAGHGLYTWGRDLAEARRQIEIFEFLFEVVARSRSWSAQSLPLPGGQPRQQWAGGGPGGYHDVQQQQ